MPKIGELWRNKQDGRIVKIVNITRGGKFGSRIFLHIESYDPTTGTSRAMDPVWNQTILAWDRIFDMDWERYESSGSGGGSSSVSTPKKKSKTEKVSTSSGSDAPMTVKKTAHGWVPPVSTTSRPQYKDGGVNNDHPHQRPLVGPNAAREAVIRENQQRIQEAMREEEELMRMLGEEDPNTVISVPLTREEERIRTINHNLSLLNGKWELTRDFHSNDNRLEVGQIVVAVGHQQGYELVRVKYNVGYDSLGRLSYDTVWISKQLFINGTFRWYGWNLTGSGIPPLRPSVREAERAAIRARELREDFGFFKNNINIKF